MKVLITFDYELFFGNKSGTFQKSILEPVEALQKIAKKYAVKFTFFRCTHQSVYLYLISPYLDLLMLPFSVSFIIWSILHSITAAKRTKLWVRRQVGDEIYDGLYRLAYNIFASVTFVPVLYFLATAVPTTIIWQIGSPIDWLFLAPDRTNRCTPSR